MKEKDRIKKRVVGLTKAVELANFYAFMLRGPLKREVIDDQTIQCAIACVSNYCYFSDCVVYETCQMESWRIGLLN